MWLLILWTHDTFFLHFKPSWQFLWQKCSQNTPVWLSNSQTSNTKRIRCPDDQTWSGPGFGVGTLDWKSPINKITTLSVLLVWNQAYVKTDDKGQTLVGRQVILDWFYFIISSLTAGQLDTHCWNIYISGTEGEEMIHVTCNAWLSHTRTSSAEVLQDEREHFQLMRRWEDWQDDPALTLTDPQTKSQQSIEDHCLQ